MTEATEIYLLERRVASYQRRPLTSWLEAVVLTSTRSSSWERPHRFQIMGERFISGGPIEFLTERVLPSLSQLIRNGLRFRVTVASPDRLIEQLSKHTIDLAVTGVKITKSGISYDLLYDEKLVLVASPYWANLLPDRQS